MSKVQKIAEEYADSTPDGKLALGFKLQAADRLQRNYRRRMNRWRIRATCGDNKAAKEVITQMADFHGTLKKMGLRTTTEYEDKHKTGTIIPITQEYIDQYYASQTELDRLRDKARTGDDDAKRAYIRKLSSTL